MGLVGTAKDSSLRCSPKSADCQPQTNCSRRFTPRYLANIFFRREGSPCRSCSIRSPKVVRPEVKLQAELKTQERNKLIGMIGGGVVQEKERKAEEYLNTLTLIDSDRFVRYHELSHEVAKI
mmetsp:Transcript_32133/g.32402  ORF Transcript_32133/g.32402 Transcript_32133/m.32402 type:complete len:122 (-) Transcript_32133:174-539(-)